MLKNQYRSVVFSGDNFHELELHISEGAHTFSDRKILLCRDIFKDRSASSRNVLSPRLLSLNSVDLRSIPHGRCFSRMLGTTKIARNPNMKRWFDLYRQGYSRTRYLCVKEYSAPRYTNEPTIFNNFTP